MPPSVFTWKGRKFKWWPELNFYRRFDNRDKNLYVLYTKVGNKKVFQGLNPEKYNSSELGEFIL